MTKAFGLHFAFSRLGLNTCVDGKCFGGIFQILDQRMPQGKNICRLIYKIEHIMSISCQLSVFKSPPQNASVPLF